MLGLPLTCDEFCEWFADYHPLAFETRNLSIFVTGLNRFIAPKIPSSCGGEPLDGANPRDANSLRYLERVIYSLEWPSDFAVFKILFTGLSDRRQSGGAFDHEFTQTAPWLSTHDKHLYFRDLRSKWTTILSFAT
jgi:hypothetical protein